MQGIVIGIHVTIIVIIIGIIIAICILYICVAYCILLALVAMGSHVMFWLLLGESQVLYCLQLA